MGKWKELTDYLDLYSTISYNEDKKKAFKKIGQSSLKELAKKLEQDGSVKNCTVSYNAGGIAVSGDHSLTGDFTSGGSFHMFFNLDGFSRFFTYRKTKNQKDWTGERNIQMPFETSLAKAAEDIKLLAK